MGRHFFLIWGLTLLCGASQAFAQGGGALVPTAEEWQRSCDAYLQGVEGNAASSDLDVSWCIGMTTGLLSGMRLGSQIGALKMASRMTVLYELKSRDVFGIFREETPESLLQICVPKTIRLRDYIMTAHAYVAATADSLPRPIHEVFFEALQKKYVCDAPRTDSAPPRGTPARP
jgi:hypothetical protein